MTLEPAYYDEHEPHDFTVSMRCGRRKTPAFFVQPAVREEAIRGTFGSRQTSLKTTQDRNRSRFYLNSTEPGGRICSSSVMNEFVGVTR